MFGWKRKARPDRAWPRLRKTEAPAPAKAKIYRFSFQLGDLPLQWEFETEAEKNTFAAGFRDGLEYQLVSLRQQGLLKEPLSMKYAPVKRQPRKGMVV